jgi:3'-5' exoribonuclease 1
MNEDVLVIDLEATCWSENNSNKPHEIIEIGYALIKKDETNNLKIIDNGAFFVKPILDPILSDFCRNLTSITQEQVDSAEDYPITLNKFIELIETKSNKKINELLFVSWGNYDKKQFEIDCQLHNVPYPFGTHENLKKKFMSKYKLRKAGMPKALEILNLELEGTHHRGKDDALNIAKIYMELAK